MSFIVKILFRFLGRVCFFKRSISCVNKKDVSNSLSLMVEQHSSKVLILVRVQKRITYLLLVFYYHRIKISFIVIKENYIELVKSVV